MSRLHHDVEFALLRKKLKNPPDTEARISILRDIIALKPRAPKNRHLQRTYREELAALQEKKKQRRHHHENTYETLGRGRVLALVGLTNTGKSTLLAGLTGTSPEVRETPFTTYQPQHGMTACRDVPVHAVEVPALFQGDSDRSKFRFLREVSVVCVCARNEQDFRETVTHLEQQTLSLRGDAATGEEGAAGKPAFVAGWTEQPMDLPGVPIGDVEAVKDATYGLLGIQRIYCVRKGSVEGPPLVFRSTLTVTLADFIAKLDRRFVGKFRQARVSGPSAKFDNETIGLDHELADGDRVELLGH